NVAGSIASRVLPRIASLIRSERVTAVHHERGAGGRAIGGEKLADQLEQMTLVAGEAVRTRGEGLERPPFVALAADKVLKQWGVTPDRRDALVCRVDPHIGACAVQSGSSQHVGGAGKSDDHDRAALTVAAHQLGQRTQGERDVLVTSAGPGDEITIGHRYRALRRAGVDDGVVEPAVLAADEICRLRPALAIADIEGERRNA